MTVLYPPVIDNMGKSIPAYVEDITTAYYAIYFHLPISLTRDAIKHLQVCIKYNSTGQPAIDSKFSPDQTTIFLDATDDSYNFEYDELSSFYIVRLNYELFKSGKPIEKKDYNIQIRFGSGVLWRDAKLLPQNPLVPGNYWAVNDGIYNFNNFNQWRKKEINKSPSGFGEWSNVQKVHCTGVSTFNIDNSFSDFTPTITCVFSSTDETQIVSQVLLTYRYYNLNSGETGRSFYETIVTSGNYLDDNVFISQIKIPIAPIFPIQVLVELVTKNNTVLTREFTIPSILSTNYYNTTLIKDLKDGVLQGDKLDDGVICKSYDASHLENNIKFNIYRINLLDLSTVKIYNELNYHGSTFEFCDYTVEMGERYIYFLMGIKPMPNNYFKYYALTPLQPWDSDNSGFGRLTKMQFSFLTTRYHQLRLEGGVQVSSFKRNTSDNLQDTIGSEFPFYSRIGKKRYRSFQLSAVISVHFDPTFTFLNFEEKTGLWWKDDNLSELIVYDTDLFNEKQISLSRQRLQKKITNQSIKQLGYSSQDNINGPRTIYGDYLYKQQILNYSTAPDDYTIFIERKFREKVMDWLSDGKPKLFRSETQGNMIVMLSGVTFSPVNASGRSVYQMSCTITEIAKYNLENLLLYDLVPIEFIAHYKSNNEFIFNPGHEDYYLYPKVIYEDDPIRPRFNIPNLVAFKPMSPINTMHGVKYGVGPFRFKTVEDYLLPSWTRYPLTNLFPRTPTSFLLPSGITIDPDTGVISGIPEILEPTSPYFVELEVTDYGQVDLGGNFVKDTMIIQIGAIYNELKLTDITIPTIPKEIIDIEITPIDLSVCIQGGFGEKVFSATNLPYGISITSEGVISGKYLYPTDSGEALIEVVDSENNVVNFNIVFEGSQNSVKFEFLEKFRIGITEAGVGYGPDDPVIIDLSQGVSGGSELYTYSIDETTQPPYDLDTGYGKMQIDSTGVLSWVPSELAIGIGGAVKVIVTDAVTGQSSFIEIPYDKVVPTFIFNLSSITIPSMPIGNIITPIDLTDIDITQGGLQFPTNSGIKYKFSEVGNLAPDFAISRDGIITGQAKVAKTARTASIKVQDYRGHSIIQNLEIGAITN